MTSSIAPPTVSIVIPAYNAARLIGATLASVLAQTHRALEVIVVDDGSTDETAAVVAAVAESDARVRLVRQANSGRPGIARNRGIDVATGAFVAFVDADDLYHPEKLERQLEAFRRVPDAALVFTDYRYFTAEPARDAEAPTLRAGNYLARVGASAMERIADDLYRSTPALPTRMVLVPGVIGAHTSTVMIRRAVIDRHAFRFREDVVLGEDTELFFRIARVGTFVFLDDPLSYYRRTPGSVTHSASRQRNALDALAVRTPMLDAVEREIAPGPDRRALAAAWRRLADVCWLGGLDADARRILAHSLRLHVTRAAALNWLKTLAPRPIADALRSRHA